MIISSNLVFLKYQQGEFADFLNYIIPSRIGTNVEFKLLVLHTIAFIIHTFASAIKCQYSAQ